MGRKTHRRASWVHRGPENRRLELFQYTLENHFRFGYDGEPFVERPSADASFTAEYGRCDSRVGDFREECRRAACLVRDSTDLPLDVLFSGGCESEIVVRSFLAAGIPIRITIMRFKNDLNRHDIQYALDFCRQRDLEFKLIELDLLDFWENRAPAYAEKSKAVSPQFPPLMWLCDQVDGFPVIGSGECFVGIRDAEQPGSVARRGEPWYLHEEEKSASWYRFLIADGRPGVPGFFQYTPELMYAFLDEDWTRRLAAGLVPGEVANERTKLKVYKKHFDLEDRPKYTGYEQVMEHDRVFRAVLESQYGQYDGVCRTEFGALMGRLRGERHGTGRRRAERIGSVQ